MAWSLTMFPLVGALVGAVVVGIVRGLGAVLPGLPVLVGLAGIVGEVLLTGALHIDGLADTADGFGGGRGDRERILRIMKDPRVGPFGVLAIVVDVIGRVVLYSYLTGEDRLWEVFWCLTLARAAQTFVLAVFPYARREGGTAGPFAARGANRFAALVSVAVAAGLAAWHLGTGGAVLGGSMLLAAVLMGGYFRVRIGGVTGDCVGAINEVATLVGLVVFAGLMQNGLPV
jgi:adenosylcobinamide-GDP ribazoletransferase